MTSIRKRSAVVIALALVTAIAPTASVARADHACASQDVVVPAAGVAIADAPRRTVRVVVPSDCGTSGDRYPVVYLLHGVGDTYTRWSEKMTSPTLPQLADQYRLIFVMPTAGSGSGAGWHSDWSGAPETLPGTALPKWETFHLDHVVPYIDEHFPTLGSGHRAVAGTSMGGFGAMYYATKRASDGKKLFAAAASFSGFLDVMHEFPISGPVYHLFGGCCKQFDDRSPDQSLGTPRREVWGDQILNEENWRAHNPKDQVGGLADTWLYVAWGTGEPCGGCPDENPSAPHLYAEERYLDLMNQSFADALPKCANHGPGRNENHLYHDWKFWTAELLDALPGMVEHIEPVTVGPGAIAGTVSRASGAKKKTARTKPLGDATVDCGVAGSTTSADDGTYSIEEVPVGTYSCTATHDGYRSEIEPDVAVASGQTTSVDFTLSKIARS